MPSENRPFPSLRYETAGYVRALATSGYEEMTL